ncbi:NAD(P)-binding domain-containing protein [Propionimicrobium sp. PCR01-08-3]|uniref:NADPH-dependent F420 reductase n=1 Tax=Propionimicrobium sp. PCR01-08-3 TaxID=3052086 RepID=UPI00255C7805|nr:NAD(P)-binding domain-containing protein [Propionimicrobium sp. PCR01-08-3]WIY83093.1 NAD(P)-binding domain-containing protein [Propionimicrobium sp. PCR01-08-3]
MTSISIVGSGNMSQALQALFTRAGATVQVVNHGDLASTAIEGDIVVLAVPYTALTEIAGTLGSKLDGKIVVDITNVLDFSSFTPIKLPAGSAAAELAAAAPNAKVLKAFNTNFAATLTSGKVESAPISVLVAGDDADAKKTFGEVVTASGAAVYDLGGLDRAAELESLGYTQLLLAGTNQIGWTNGFALFK